MTAIQDRPPVAAPEKRELFARSEALIVANKFVEYLERQCYRVVVAGSLRRRKQEVSDIEILFVPRVMSVKDPGDLFGAQVEKSAADLALDKLLDLGVITKRPNKNGAFTWGPENKLGIHVESGIPVDLFATDEDRFFNALFVRTGPADLNRRVATLAKEQGWDWHAYGDGFTRAGGTNSTNRRRVKSEYDVFHHVGLTWKEPWDR